VLLLQRNQLMVGQGNKKSNANLLDFGAGMIKKGILMSGTCVFSLPS
jgi:hypothetical protein